MSAVPQIPPEPRSSAAASQDRRIQMLRTAMGPVIAAALEDPDVVEVMLNPDRTLWVDRLSSGRAPLGVELPEADGERIIRLVAAHVGADPARADGICRDAGFGCFKGGACCLNCNAGLFHSFLCCPNVLRKIPWIFTAGIAAFRSRHFTANSCGGVIFHRHIGIILGW